ncbi:hypothetical protein DFJ73DRAFT_958906, partial [Zopfochytrium polystomum]
MAKKLQRRQQQQQQQQQPTPPPPLLQPQQPPSTFDCPLCTPAAAAVATVGRVGGKEGGKGGAPRSARGDGDGDGDDGFLDHLSTSHKFDFSNAEQLKPRAAFARSLLAILGASVCPSCGVRAEDRHALVDHLQRKPGHRRLKCLSGARAERSHASTRPSVTFRKVHRPLDTGAKAIAAQPTPVALSSCSFCISLPNKANADLTDDELREHAQAVSDFFQSPKPGALGAACGLRLLEYISRLRNQGENAVVTLSPAEMECDEPAPTHECACFGAKGDFELDDVDADAWTRHVEFLEKTISDNGKVMSCCVKTLAKYIDSIDTEVNSPLKEDSCVCPNRFSAEELAEFSTQQLRQSVRSLLMLERESGTDHRTCCVQRQIEFIRRLSSTSAGQHGLSLFIQSDDLLPGIEAQKFPDGLGCPICLDVLTAPHIIACGHSFCQDCLVVWLKKAKKCPLCSADVAQKPARNLGLWEQVQAFLKTSSSSSETDEKETPGKLKSKEDPWSVLFPKKDPRAIAIADKEDGVLRCGRCHWEIVDGFCAHCQEPYEVDNASDEDGSGDEEDEDEEGNLVDDLAEVDGEEDGEDDEYDDREDESGDDDESDDSFVVDDDAPIEHESSDEEPEPELSDSADEERQPKRRLKRRVGLSVDSDDDDDLEVEESNQQSDAWSSTAGVAPSKEDVENEDEEEEEESEVGQQFRNVNKRKRKASS